MTAIETLMHEHQVIMLVLGAAEEEAKRIREGEAVNRDKIAKMLEFFRNFADKCHHAKEEDLLFVRMVERGMPREGGPIAVMLHEHNLGRAHLKGVDDALEKAVGGDAEAAATVAKHLYSYVDLLRMHIQKEDNILYPMARNYLSPKDFEELSTEFDRVEREEMGEGTHEKFHQLAHELAGKH